MVDDHRAEPTIAGGLARADAPASPEFTRKPAAVKSGGKIRIEFAIDSETDVVVRVEDADGR